MRGTVIHVRGYFGAGRFGCWAQPDTATVATVLAITEDSTRAVEETNTPPTCLTISLTFLPCLRAPKRANSCEQRSKRTAATINMVSVRPSPENGIGLNPARKDYMRVSHTGDPGLCRSADRGTLVRAFHLNRQPIYRSLFGGYR